MLGFVAAFYGTWLGFGGRGFAITLGVFAFFLAGQVVVAARGVQERIARLLGPHGAPALAVLPLFAYLIYALGTNTFTWWRAGLAIAYVLAPFLLLTSSRTAAPGAWQDYVAILLLWLPVEFRWLHHLWPYPGQRLGHILTELLAVTVGILAFLFVRRLDGVGYTIAWGRGWGFQVGVNFVLFAAIAIPLGQVLRFIHFDPAYGELKTLPLTVLGMFLFIAWPEEFLFRGLLQNLLARTLGSARAGWLLAAVIFGLAHINNGGFPNWRYVILATIAGICYGRAWQKTGSIFASALVHTMVNLAWHLLFRTV